MHGLYLWWWVQERHVPAASVAAILAAGDLAVTALEVPTGWLADRFGHRASLIAGSTLQIAGMLAAWLAGGTPGVLASSLLIAGGDAFRSGADQALLYRSCAALGREPDFQSIVARAQAAQLAALVVFVLAGGAIVTAWGFAAGWIVETGMSALGLLIAVAMIEPPAAAIDSPNAGSSSGPRQRSRAAAMIGRVLPASLLAGAASAAAFLAQTGGTLGPARVTMLVAVVTLAEAGGAAAAARMAASNRVQVVLAACGVAIAALAALHHGVVAPAAVALAFLMGVAEPLRAASIQRAASDGARATAASVASACDKACMTIALITAGQIG